MLCVCIYVGQVQSKKYQSKMKVSSATEHIFKFHQVDVISFFLWHVSRAQSFSTLLQANLCQDINKEKKVYKKMKSLTFYIAMHFWNKDVSKVF